jgi:hypothetical protein
MPPRLLDAVLVLAGAGVDFDLVADFHEGGTGSSMPVLILAGFMTLPEVSPLTAGSV